MDYMARFILWIFKPTFTNKEIAEILCTESHTLKEYKVYDRPDLNYYECTKCGCNEIDRTLYVKTYE